MAENSFEKHEALSHDAVVRALLENYESIYAVDAETSEYQCFHESDQYSSLRIESRGKDFFDEADSNIFRTIYIEDQKYVRRMISKKVMLSALSKDKFYSFVYRLMIDGKPLYHKLRATTDIVDGRRHFLIGVRNIDTAFRQDKAQAEELSAMHSKESNHLEVILASAEGYLEANLTKDRILEFIPDLIPAELPKGVKAPDVSGSMAYSEFEKWRIENLIIENKKKYIEISDRNYLIKCFERGEKRASVSFSMRTAGGGVQPCRKFFYLHRDPVSGDVLSFCVLYDLTEQQRREKEIQDLERELQLSRLRNFTSQMQPHFLYNALGSIQEIVLDDPAYASELLGDFTVHLRSCIRAMANDSPIPFEQELANIKAYVNIEKMRFGEKLKVVFDVKTENFSVLPLSIQPLVENAIRHGIYERGERGGKVVIRTAETDGEFRITVEDNGVGFDVDAFWAEVSSGRRDSTGLKNIMFRLDKVMHASVDISSRVGKGTRITVNIPKEGVKNESDHS